MKNQKKSVARQALVGLLLTLGAGVATAQVTIDDFSTGAYRRALYTGQDSGVQTGAMAGGSRSTLFVVCSAPCANPFAQPSSLQIRPSTHAGVPSALIVTSGYYMSPGLTLTYGVTTPLNLDATAGGANDRFRLNFHGANAPLRVDLIVRSGAVFVDLSCAIPFTGLAALPFSVDFPFSAFSVKGLDLTHVDLVQLGGNGVVDVDFALTSIQAVPPSPGTFTCGPVGSI